MGNDMGHTSYAGGSRVNRRFDGIVEPDREDDIAYFDSSSSLHHYGSFNRASEDPESWRLMIKYTAGYCRIRL